MSEMAAAGAMPADTQGMPAGRRAAAGAVLAGLGVLGVLFHEEIAAAVGVWSESTAYGHCFFIIPISLFLAWERRAAIRVTPVRPMPWLGLLAIPAGLAWFAAERLGIMEGQQIIAMGLVELLFLAVLGWRMGRVLAVPLLYLGFLVPSGAFATPALQSFTAHFIANGLDLLGIANISDGNTIEIPEGVFYVAQACAGLRFLIASIAFGVLYACMIYRSPRRRLAFIAASVAIPVVANGIRALGIVALGHALGSAEAAAVDHVVYGWLFFSAVILVLILAGLPFREDNEAEPLPVWRAVPAATASPWLAAGLALGLAAIAPAIAGWLDRRAEAETAVAASPPDLRGCQPSTAAGPAAVAYVCPVHGFVRDHLVVTVTRLPARANPGALTRLRRAATGELAAEDATTIPLPGGFPGWTAVMTTGPDRVTATAAWIDGRLATGGFAQRRLQAWDSVFGAAHDQVLVTIATADAAPGAGDPRLLASARQQAVAAIGQLLQLNPGLQALGG